jgi:hypothetical protein
MPNRTRLDIDLISATQEQVVNFCETTAPYTLDHLEENHER